MLQPEYKPEFESLKELLLDMAQERSVGVLLQMIVERLSARPHVALARVWLIRPGDLCERCARRQMCPDPTRCLHLAASGGAAPAEGDSDLRVPIGVGTLGLVASTGRACRIEDTETAPDWLEENPWARGLGILGFSAQPLVFKEEVLGVLALYIRIRLMGLNEGTPWVRMIANQAAISMANAHAFEEIERLKKKLELENAYLREELNEVQAFGDILGQSPAILNVMRQVELVGPTDASVLILGESGTGKELVAREIHRHSLRKDRPLIRVNCASIPRELYESEFFGHVKGAFTGAHRDRPGRFEAADGGTLFLDEVGEIPVQLQAKLLRVLQEGQYERVGDDRTRQVDVRIIAASNRDIKKEVEAGYFRQDFYYRLNVFPIEVAPLRERKEDILLLAAHFLHVATRKMNRPIPSLTPDHVRELRDYDWPGNVRELQNIIERAMITVRSGSLRLDLPSSRRQDGETARAAEAARRAAEPTPLTEAEMKQRAKENTLAALNRCGWKVYGPGGAAEALEVKPTTLIARIRKLGMRKPR
jgi:transcriptional regulator with GAF, ATPase, and Fis domain